MSFSDATFSVGEVSFHGATFSDDGHVSFGGASFCGGGVVFSHATSRPI